MQGKRRRKRRKQRRSRNRSRKRHSTLSHQKLEERNLLAADFLGSFGSMPHLQASFSQTLVERTSGESRSNQNPDHGRDSHDETVADAVIEVRSLDGTGNNLENPELGSVGEQLLRTSESDYADGISEPAGEDRVSAREISNEIAAQTTTETNDRSLTDLTWIFGQFIDHDIDLTEGGEAEESFAIEVPTGDEFFDPFFTGEVEMDLTRSVFDETTGETDAREQINEISAFLDGSVIYGSDVETADALRTFEGGLLATSEGDLLPFAQDDTEDTSDDMFLAGDIRANENIALTSMHTIWVREHNYQAELLAAEDPTLTDEQLYQGARTIVTAQLQAITFNEYLPALLGEEALAEYTGYDSSIDPGIANVFSTAAYRFGHTMLSSELLRLDSDLTEAEEGNIALQNAFFSPDEIVDNGIESVLLGASVQEANEIDNQVIDDVRNFLFGPPGAGGFDLVSLNIQRGRDHGLADYNQVRSDYGLEPVTSFDEISSDSEVAAKLELLYGSVDNIDVWVGGLAEDHVEGSSMGELFSTIIVDQFERIRDGDRLWYQNVFSGSELAAIENTTLADVIERNSSIDGLQDNVFFSADAQPETETPDLTERKRENTSRVANNNRNQRDNRGDRDRNSVEDTPVDSVRRESNRSESTQRSQIRSPAAIDSAFEEMFSGQDKNRFNGRRS